MVAVQLYNLTNSFDWPGIRHSITAYDIQRIYMGRCFIPLICHQMMVVITSKRIQT